MIAEKKGFENLNFIVIFDNIFMTVVYGISTGFGKFANTVIDEDKIV